jgi:hypothetical protein
MRMKFAAFVEAISTQMWEKVGRANWRSFHGRTRIRSRVEFE